MATLNKKVRNYTHEGAPAKNIDAVSQLERSVMACLLWEDTFYEDGKLIADRITDLCKQVPVDELARIAIQAKQDMRLRHVPLLLAYNLTLTKAGLKLFGAVADKVILRADDLNEFMAIYWREKKHPIAKQVKKHLGEAFRKFDEYQLQKYNGGSKAIKLKDVMKLVRPKPADEAQAALWKRLIKDELATPDTWEVAISATKDKKAEWIRLLKEGKLGGLAMLRNVRNMVQAGVPSDEIAIGIQGINAGRLLPINFIASARHNVQFEPHLENKFFECFANKEQYTGKTILLIDVSGSMDEQLAGRSEMRRLDVACSLAMIGREIFKDVRVFTFSSSLVEVPARRGFALRDAIVNSQPHGSTQLGQAVATIVAQHPFDRLIVLTDEQSHDRVPEVKGYMINVATNKHGVGYGSWLHIDGWSDKVLDYIVRFENQR